jgi:hypothetical protein
VLIEPTINSNEDSSYNPKPDINNNPDHGRILVSVHDDDKAKLLLNYDAIPTIAREHSSLGVLGHTGLITDHSIALYRRSFFPN